MDTAPRMRSKFYDTEQVLLKDTKDTAKIFIILIYIQIKMCKLLLVMQLFRFLYNRSSMDISNIYVLLYTIYQKEKKVVRLKRTYIYMI